MGPDGFGGVQSGELRISAQATVGKVNYQSPSGDDGHPKQLYVDFDESHIGEAERLRRSRRSARQADGKLPNRFSLQTCYAIWLPGVDHVPPGSDLHCVYTGQNVSYGPYDSEYWVVLRQVQRGGRAVFERVGVIQSPQDLLRRGGWGNCALYDRSLLRRKALWRLWSPTRAPTTAPPPRHRESSRQVYLNQRPTLL